MEGRTDHRSQRGVQLLRALLAADQPQTPPELRAVLTALDRYVDSYTTHARLGGAA